MKRERERNREGGREEGKENAVYLSNASHISLVTRRAFSRRVSVLNLPRRGSQDPMYVPERKGRRRASQRVYGVSLRDVGRGRRCRALGRTIYDGIEMRLSRQASLPKPPPFTQASLSFLLCSQTTLYPLTGFFFDKLFTWHETSMLVLSLDTRQNSFSKRIGTEFERKERIHGNH